VKTGRSSSLTVLLPREGPPAPTRAPPDLPLVPTAAAPRRSRPRSSLLPPTMTQTSYNAPLATAPAASYSTVLCVTPEQLQRAMAIRYQVFVEEQGYDAKIEVDG
jgi:hypothetical protein